ncbi:glycerate kinase [Motilibacter deserti]|uniref:glycerate kinase n=1 Tax=Motilibacter deserti TaxID=2714956 RepID=UPI002F2B4C3D
MGEAVRVVLAPDKFKGSLPATEVVAALRHGLLALRPGLDVVEAPVADGGDGTLAAVLSAGWERIPVEAPGPTGEPVATAYARSGDTAVMELADACGLGRLPGGVVAPLTAGTAGAGAVVRAALDAGCRRVLLGIGGSASTDGGAGLVQALGARLLDADGRELPPGGGALAGLARLDLSGLHPGLARAEVFVACDVDNPLTGPHGAGAVYAPQKGASANDVAVLDSALTHWADVVAAATGRDARNDPGAGAAGGVGFAAVALLGAVLRPGVELVLDLVGFDERVSGAALVVVGEGSLDAQTLHGKAVAGVAAAARRAGARVVAVAGRCTLAPEQLRQLGVEAAYALTDVEPDVQVCIEQAPRLLGLLAERIVADGHVSG